MNSVNNNNNKKLYFRKDELSTIETSSRVVFQCTTSYESLSKDNSNKNLKCNSNSNNKINKKNNYKYNKDKLKKLFINITSIKRSKLNNIL
jgi:hypothetical protein